MKNGDDWLIPGETTVRLPDGKSGLVVDKLEKVVTVKVPGERREREVAAHELEPAGRTDVNRAIWDTAPGIDPGLVSPGDAAVLHFQVLGSLKARPFSARQAYCYAWHAVYMEISGDHEELREVIEDIFDGLMRTCVCKGRGCMQCSPYGALRYWES